MITSVRQLVLSRLVSLPSKMTLMELSGAQAVGTLVGTAVTGVASGVMLAIARVGLCSGRALGLGPGDGVAIQVSVADGVCVTVGAAVAVAGGFRTTVVDGVAEGSGEGVHVGGMVTRGERGAVAVDAVGLGVEDGAAARRAGAVGLDQGIMGFRRKCLMPITSRAAPQSSRIVSTMRRYR
jgi:hypothetical protein